MTSMVTHYGYACNMLGNRVATIDALSNAVHRTFDPFGRVLSEDGTIHSGAATPSIAYTYHDSDKLASVTLSDGTSYAYAYDDRLLCTNEAVALGDAAFHVVRSYDEFRRAQETSVIVTNARHAAKIRLYDSENRISGYALTNAAGRVVSVSFIMNNCVRSLKD